MINKRKFLSIVLLTFLITYFKFFKPLGIDDVILKSIYYLLLIIISASVLLNNKIIKKAEFKKNIYFYFLSLSLSIISAYIHWGQSITNTIISSIPLLSFMGYFYLHKFEYTKIEIENIIWIFTIIYSVLFILAILVYPNRIFEGYGELDKAIDTSRGFPRIRLTLIGASPIYLSFFIAISKVKESLEKKWVAISLFLFVLIVLQLGRQSIVLSLLLGIIFLLNNFGFSKKILITLSSIMIISFAYSQVEIIQDLYNYSRDQFLSYENYDDNIRVGAYKFYFNEVSPNITTSIIGNGQYSLGYSDYGEFIDNMGRANGYIPADVGYAHIYLIFGAFGLLIFASILFKALLLKIDDQYAYAKYYLLFLFLSNIAGNTLLGAIPSFCISIYLIDLGYQIHNKNC